MSDEVSRLDDSTQDSLDAWLLETTLRSKSVPTTNTLCQLTAVPKGEAPSSVNAQIAETYRTVSSSSLDRVVLRPRFLDGGHAALWIDLLHVGGEVLVSSDGGAAVRLADFLRNVIHSDVPVSGEGPTWLVQDVVLPLPLGADPSAREAHSARLVIAWDDLRPPEIQSASFVSRLSLNSEVVESGAIDVATGLLLGGLVSNRGKCLKSWRQIRSTALEASAALAAQRVVEWEVVLSPSGPVVVGARPAP